MFFSFFSFFLPLMPAYSSEIRMYGWAMLFVTLAGIYGYRFYKNIKDKNLSGRRKNLLLFGIFSILSCYTHYYATAAVAIMNLLLLISAFKNKGSNKKAFKGILLLDIVQVLLFIPWLGNLFGQIGHVKAGFWIADKIKSFPIDFLSLQFGRYVNEHFKFTFGIVVSAIVGLIYYIYLFNKIRKQKRENENIKAASLCFKIYFGIVIVMAIFSLIIWEPVLYTRYFVILTGLWILGSSIVLSNEKAKGNVLLIVLVTVILSCAANVQNLNMNLSSTNNEMHDYLKEYVKEDDIIIYSNIGNGGVVCALFPDNKQYFVNLAGWEDIENAYKAYGPGMETVSDFSFLEGFTGRIWVIDSEAKDFYEAIPKDNIVLLRTAKTFYTPYHGYVYNISLVEKY